MWCPPKQINRCLLIAPHGGGIEPGTSEIMRVVAAIGGWAWYEFAGFLQKGNGVLHIPSTAFDEPTLLGLLKRTNFVVSFHGETHEDNRIVFVGGAWERGRNALTASINATAKKHGIPGAGCHGELAQTPTRSRTVQPYEPWKTR